ncbi:membrane-spanning 4-domains subfamily A member 15-like [Carassius carassius]|uniref:membrane-spanning 4-domains subfamily A member 15-like n=1 Tax=Carassius carassius TaxID=217509 RepID=UPI002868B488|nr:membrane-spanning 4-domains subfamily A member 15-like [Carassius carassius]
MPKPADEMPTVPVHQRGQYAVSSFLKVKPLAVGILELSLALLGLGLTIWNVRFSFLWASISFILTGALTISAARTCKPCLVKSSQMLSCFNAAAAALSLRFHFYYSWGVICFLLMACDTLILIFSVTVALSFFSCSCRPKSRRVEISYMNADLPVNHVVVMGQPDPFAVAQSVSSVMYVLPAHVSLPNYSPVLDIPPPAYDQISATPPPNYSSVPSAPPPAYEI